jgi:hypothetical protein
MAKLTINIGTTPNSRNGDPLREAFNKVNENFSELYSAISQVTGGTATDRLVAGSNVLILETDGSLTFPNASVQTTAYTGAYTPATPADWAGTAPTTMAAAIDRLAARIKLIDGGIGA